MARFEKAIDNSKASARPMFRAAPVTRAFFQSEIFWKSVRKIIFYD
ncbi:MAG: hypothetical protein IKA87_04300 [Lentisphaeria bacterium]|nr:hypothetical protein [Lentisphaeria bacterium]